MVPDINIGCYSNNEPIVIEIINYLQDYKKLQIYYFNTDRWFS